MDKQYPDGAIKSYEELCQVNRHDADIVYSASREFGMERSRRILTLSLAFMLDHNIPANQYNDWFLFTDKDKAKEWANG